MSVNDPNATKPVALLGRPGPARDRLREAITLAGAQVVFEEEPVMVSPAKLLAVNPVAIIIALDPVIEEALLPLEAVLQKPGITVLFDDADVAARREGWDAQRWIRHLSAKLFGHSDVLPPRRLNRSSPVSLSLGLHSDAPTDADNPLSVPLPANPLNHKIPSSRPLTSQAPAPTMPSPSQGSFASSAGLAKPMPSRQIANDQGQLADHAIAASAAPPTSSASFQSVNSSNVGLKNVGDKPGVIIVLAGVGGADALRHFFSALPRSLRHPIILAMTMNMVQCNNLVRQLQRTSPLPVSLAMIGDVVSNRKVFVVPNDVGVRSQLSHLIFDRFQSLPAWLEAVPTRQSAVLMLSGGSLTAVETVLTLRAKGAWVAAQSPIGCYDPSAASQLIHHGCPSAEPAQLAADLIVHLPIMQPQVRRQ